MVETMRKTLAMVRRETLPLAALPSANVIMLQEARLK
jgi:hypothetical protein